MTVQPHRRAGASRAEPPFTLAAGALVVVAYAWRVGRCASGGGRMLPAGRYNGRVRHAAAAFALIDLVDPHGQKTAVLHYMRSEIEAGDVILRPDLNLCATCAREVAGRFQEDDGRRAFQCFTCSPMEPKITKVRKWNRG